MFEKSKLSLARHIFFLSRIFITVLFCFYFFTSIASYGVTLRDAGYLLSFTVCMVVSYVYEKKQKIPGLPYIIYLVICFFVSNSAPYHYIHNEIAQDTVIRSAKAIIPGDCYQVYLVTFLIVSAIFGSYLVLSQPLRWRTISLRLRIARIEPLGILLSGNFLLIPIWIGTGSGGGYFGTIMSVFCTYFFVAGYLCRHQLLSVIRRNRIFRTWLLPFSLCAGVTIASLIVGSVFFRRFVALEYLFPVIMAFLYLVLIQSSRKTQTFFTTALILTVIVLAAFIYGVVSEMKKLAELNNESSFHWSDVLGIANFGIAKYWLGRQVYRLFDIWAVLGGNVIEYTQVHGFLFGLSYVKIFSSVFDFEHVDLAILSAQLLGVSYAQPGIVAEGYANFGILGSVFNVCLVLFCAEYLQRRFLLRQTMFNLLLLVSLFTKIILDGGSINSAIVNAVYCFCTFYPIVILKHFTKSTITQATQIGNMPQES